MGEGVDVEQIMRDIRAQIAQRHGIELSNQQIQELAARRLEAILDPLTVKPALLDQLRRGAGSPADTSSPNPQPAYTFEGQTLYESHNGLLRLIRRMLNPVLRLFFNPNPLILALNAQTRWNTEAARRETERDRRQMEWNALHYTILQRLVTEVSRVSIEAQSLSMRVESFAAKVDFNERRVRGLESTSHQSTPAPRAVDAGAATVLPTAPPAPDASVSEGQSEGARRRRRRRRGRRGTGVAPLVASPTSSSTGSIAPLGVPEMPAEEPEDHSPSVVSVADEQGTDSSIAWPVDEPHEAGSGEVTRVESAPMEISSSEPVSHVETHDTPPPSPPAEPTSFAQPSPAPDEPFPAAPFEPPDRGPSDR